MKLCYVHYRDARLGPRFESHLMQIPRLYSQLEDQRSLLPHILIWFRSIFTLDGTKGLLLPFSLFVLLEPLYCKHNNTLINHATLLKSIKITIWGPKNNNLPLFCRLVILQFNLLLFCHSNYNWFWGLRGLTTGITHIGSLKNRVFWWSGQFKQRLLLFI